MRSFRSIAAAAFVACALPVTLEAQFAGSMSASLMSYASGDEQCLLTSSGAAMSAAVSTSAYCYDGGRAAVATYDPSNRSLMLSVLDLDDNTSNRPILVAQGIYQRALSIVGTAARGNALRVHVQTLFDQVDLPSHIRDAWTNAGLSVTLGTASVYYSELSNSSGRSVSGGATPTAAGFDFYFAMMAGSFTTTNYVVYAAAAEYLGDRFIGGYQNLDATLLGLDVVDEQGNVLGVATMGADGLDVIDISAVAAPEPASLALLTTGLIGIAGVVRIRKRA